MQRQLFLTSSRRLAGSSLKPSFLALAGAAALLLGCQDGSGTAPGGLEPSPSSQRSEVDRGTPGARSGSDFSGDPTAAGGGAEEGSSAASDREVVRDQGAGSGAETGTRSTGGAGSAGSADEVARDSGTGTGAETSPGDDEGSDGGSVN